MRKLNDSGVEWIGEIPLNWTVKPLKWIVKFGKGLPITKDNLIEQGVPVVSYGQIHSKANNGTHLQDELIRFVSEAYLESNPLSLGKKGDIFFADTSEDYAGIGNAVLVDIDAPVFAGYHTVIVRPNDQSYSRYLAYLFLTDAWRSQLCSRASGIKVFSITQGLLKKTTVILPPAEKIAGMTDYLDRKCSQIDAIIARQQEVIEKLKAYKLSVITEAVTKGLNPDAPMKDSGVEWIGEIPEHWSESTILRNIRFEGGSQPPLEHFIDEPRKGYIRLIQNRDYRTDDYATYVPITMVSKFCTKEDVMIGRYGPPIFVIHRGLDGAYNVALMKAVPINIDREFMFFYLQNSTLLNYIESFSVRTAGQSGVNPNILKRYPMFIPPIEEQKQIAKGLLENCHHIDNLVANKKSIVEKLISYKRSLIYEVVTGKREV